MLSEERRKQLDEIVQQMATNKEPDANIQAVVNDFKSKYGAGITESKPQISGAQKSAEQFKPLFPAQEQESMLGAAAKTVGNIPSSGVRFGVETVKGVAGLLNPMNII